MTIHDTLPERRNLVVLSVGIILFFIGEGKLSNGELKLQFLSVEFNNLLGLQITVWFFLLWFIYRYWVVSSSTYWDDVQKDFYSVDLYKKYNTDMKRIELLNRETLNLNTVLQEKIQKVYLYFDKNDNKLKYEFKTRINTGT